MSLSLGFAGLLGGIIGPSLTIGIIAIVSVVWGSVFLVITRNLRADAEAEAAAVSAGSARVTELS